MGELQKGGRKQEKKSEASMMDPASVCVCCELGKGGKKMCHCTSMEKRPLGGGGRGGRINMIAGSKWFVSGFSVVRAYIILFVCISRLLQFGSGSLSSSLGSRERPLRFSFSTPCVFLTPQCVRVRNFCMHWHIFFPCPFLSFNFFTRPTYFSNPSQSPWLPSHSQK